MVALLLLAGCGGASPASPTLSRASALPAQRARAAEPEPELALTGGLGGISPYSVEEAITPHMEALASCVEGRALGAQRLGGRARLAFRIHLDGSVRWVHVRESNLGNREAERCLTQVAEQVRFRRPGGGEAEFSWTVELDDPGEEVALDALARRPAVTRVARRVHAACGEPEGVQVTAWVAAGRVVSAGAAVRDQEHAAALDCVTSAFRGARLPSAGRRLTRVSFALAR